MRITAALIALFGLLVACGDNHEGHDHGGNGGSHNGDLDAKTKKIDAAMAKLSTEDQKLARAQKICPVGGGPLGGMGTPVKVEVKDQTVFLCCAGCIDRIKADPDKYLAKLK